MGRISAGALPPTVLPLAVLDWICIHNDWKLFEQPVDAECQCFNVPNWQIVDCFWIGGWVFQASISTNNIQPLWHFISSDGQIPARAPVIIVVDMAFISKSVRRISSTNRRSPNADIYSIRIDAWNTNPDVWKTNCWQHLASRLIFTI